MSHSLATRPESQPAAIIPNAAQPDSAALSTTEAKDLRKLESVIERGLKTFLEVGTALWQIKDEKLYRRDYRTFGEYCQDRWGFAKVYAHYLIQAVQVTNNLKVHNCEQLPATESQTRPLAQLPVAQQANAWQDVVEECKERGEPVTAAAVVEVVQKYKAQAEPYREVQQHHGQRQFRASPDAGWTACSDEMVAMIDQEGHGNE